MVHGGAPTFKGPRLSRFVRRGGAKAGSRGLTIARAINPANVLTAARLGLVPVFLWLVVIGESRAAFWVFIAAAATDFFDGFVARSFGIGTPLGAFLDVLADKLLLVSAFVALPWAAARDPLSVDRALVWVTSGCVIARHVVLVGLWVFGRSRGGSLLPTTWMGKTSTALQMITVPGTLLPLRAGWLVPLYYVTLFSTFYSGGEYLWEGFARLTTARREQLLKPPR